MATSLLVAKSDSPKLLIVNNKIEKINNAEVLLLKKELNSAYTIFSLNDIDKRVLVLEKINTLIEKIYYKDNLRDQYHSELKKELTKFYDFLLKQKAATITDIKSLVGFLKQFSKREALQLLSIYIQTYTTPIVDNEIHYFPEEFHARKVGECDDVAIYTSKILSELDIKTDVVEVVMDIQFAIEMNVGSHAITIYLFKEEEKKYTGFIDNYGINENKEKYFFKKFLNKTIPSADSYRIVDLKIWEKYKEEKKDPIRNDFDHFKNYQRIAIIKKADALKYFKGIITLEDLFDNPEDDVLYFKKNAEDIIHRAKVEYSKKIELENLYYECSNRFKK